VGIDGELGGELGDLFGGGWVGHGSVSGAT
jgi:hypothetical protein